MMLGVVTSRDRIGEVQLVAVKIPVVNELLGEAFEILLHFR